MPKHTFVEHLLKGLQLFRCQVLRVQSQYRKTRRLGEILLWMDFAENYTCASVEEVQSAYWNTGMVSLHTMVAYFPGDRAPRILQSYVTVRCNFSQWNSCLCHSEKDNSNYQGRLLCQQETTLLNRFTN